MGLMRRIPLCDRCRYQSLCAKHIADETVKDGKCRIFFAESAYLNHCENREKKKKEVTGEQPG